MELPAVKGGYDDIETMLEAEHPDAVSIVTPDHLHRAHAEACLEAGCHVLLTKPLATNLEDGRAILRAAEAASRKLMVAHERRYRRHIRALKKMLDAGDLGEVIHLRIDAIQDKREQFLRAPWYASAEAGRTALVGSGIHEVDLLRHLIGEPIESVAAFSNRLGTLEFPRDKTAAALFHFAGGSIGQVTVTYEAHWPLAGSIDDHFRLVGTTGIVVGLRVARDGRDEWEELPGDANPLVEGTRGCVAAFLRAICEDAPVPIPGQDAFASLAACVAADDSAARGEPVAPADFDAA
jgi:predicted dehydrogenase